MECICGSQEFEPAILYQMVMGTKIPFPIHVCKKCGLVYAPKILDSKDVD